jgi:hypothetical protein
LSLLGKHSTSKSILQPIFICEKDNYLNEPRSMKKN